MKTSRFLLAAFAAITFFTSCESDDDIQNLPDPEEQGTFANGIFILNEGNFGSGNSSVFFLSNDHSELSGNIYSEVNGGEALGDVAQSIGFFEELAFIVVNVSNKIEVVNRNTFEHIATIDEGLQNPRYVAFANDFAYITNWGDGSDPEDDYVAVVDVETFAVVENIPVVEGPEAILQENGILYVAHQGGYSFNDKISVINSGENTVSKTITVGDRPNSMEIANGQLYVLTGGLPSWSGEEKAGKLVSINLTSREVSEEIFFPNVTDHPSNLKIEDNSLYYTLGKAVYRMDAGNTQLPGIPFTQLDEVAVLYGFEVKDGTIYAASANPDFTGDGNLYLYSTTDGSLMDSFEVGINPNGIYFNN